MTRLRRVLLLVLLLLLLLLLVLVLLLVLALVLVLLLVGWRAPPFLCGPGQGYSVFARADLECVELAPAFLALPRRDPRWGQRPAFA